MAFQNMQQDCHLLKCELRSELVGGGGHKIKVLPVYKAIWRSGGIAPLVLNLGNRWSPQYPLYSRARLDTWKERKISCPCRVSKHSSPGAIRCANLTKLLEQPTYRKHHLEIVNLDLLNVKKSTSIPWLPQKLIMIFFPISRRYFKLWAERDQPTDK
jgi:hypothetical protein